ncbi:MAG: hypothetical protein HN370_08370 [Phycisphaerales bacterium]|jgi:hypothetical protein|nr:hypothetical protein [Phycisphaerales bacterium]
MKYGSIVIALFAGLLGGCFDSPGVRLIAPRMVVEGGERTAIVTTFHGYPEIDWTQPPTAEITAGPWHSPQSKPLTVQRIGHAQRRSWRIHLPKIRPPATLTITVPYDGWIYRISTDLVTPSDNDLDPTGKTILYKREDETTLPLRPDW